jgi:hypothetical protein
MRKKITPANSRFAKAGVSCLYDSEVLNSSCVHLMKFSAKNPRPSQSGKTLWHILNETIDNHIDNIPFDILLL